MQIYAFLFIFSMYMDTCIAYVHVQHRCVFIYTYLFSFNLILFWGVILLFNFSRGKKK
jgi:hypothetical protein